MQQWGWLQLRWNGDVAAALAPRRHPQRPHPRHRLLRCLPYCLVHLGTDWLYQKY
eukprot:COSAG02_NODE_4786_length_4977_cov_6.788233_3_plen_55_part_00